MQTNVLYMQLCSCCCSFFTPSLHLPTVPPACVVSHPPGVFRGEGRWCTLPWFHPLRVITVTNNPMMTTSPNSFNNKDRILIWYLQQCLSVDSAACLLFFPVYMWKRRRCVFVCGLGHGRKAFCVACLFYYDVFTWLRACVPVAWCCYVSKGPNCSLRGTDKQIEQATFLFTTCRVVLFHLYTVYFCFLLPALSDSFLSKSLYEYFWVWVPKLVHAWWFQVHATVRFTSAI